MDARTVRFSVASSSAQQIAQALNTQYPSTPAFSSELTTPRYLGETTINTPVPNRGTLGPSARIPFNADNTPSNTVTLMYWAGKAKWYNPSGSSSTGEWWFSSGTTGRYSGSLTMVRYDVSTDSFAHWQGDSYTDATNSCFGPWGAPHNFDGMALNPTAGKIYRNLVPYSGGPYINAIGIWDIASKTGTTVQHEAGYVDNYSPVEFFPNMGTAGTVLFFCVGNVNYPIRRFDVATGLWSAPIANPYALTMGVTCYHNGKVYWTDGGAGKGFYALTPSGTIETKTSTPVQMNLGGVGSFEPTNYAVLMSLGSYIYAFCNRVVYRFDPAANGGAGSWTTYDAFPWAATNQDAYFAVGPLTTLGVALFVRSISDFQHQAVMWKP